MNIHMANILFVMLILFSDTSCKFMLLNLKSVSSMYNFQNAEQEDMRNSFDSLLV
jgi:hypothetical protein